MNFCDLFHPTKTHKPAQVPTRHTRCRIGYEVVNQGRIQATDGPILLSSALPGEQIRIRDADVIEAAR